MPKHRNRRYRAPSNVACSNSDDTSSETTDDDILFRSDNGVVVRSVTNARRAGRGLCPELLMEEPAFERRIVTRPKKPNQRVIDTSFDSDNSWETINTQSEKDSFVGSFNSLKIKPKKDSAGKGGILTYKDKISSKEVTQSNSERTGVKRKAINTNIAAKDHQYVDVQNNKLAQDMIKDLVSCFTENKSLPTWMQDRINTKMCIEMSSVFNNVLNDCAEKIFHKVDGCSNKVAMKKTKKKKTVDVGCQTVLTGGVISQNIFHDNQSHIVKASAGKKHSQKYIKGTQYSHLTS